MPKKSINKFYKLNLDWINNVQVNLSAVERRTSTLVKRRTVKKEYQVAWLLKSITLLDLTTLSGDDTFGKIDRLCEKAINPISNSIITNCTISNNNGLGIWITNNDSTTILNSILTGNTDLVGGYPLSDLIYPPSLSKRYLTKNMMLFWTNFAKTGDPGSSTNSVNWEKYYSNESTPNYLVLDKKKNLKMIEDSISFSSLLNELVEDTRVNDLEKCVILLQMFTFVGDDIYDENIANYPKNCNRSESEKFLIDNASFIEY